MKTFCDYCGSVIEDTVDKCPNCGAVNQHVMRSGNQVPKTIEELKAFAAEQGIPLEKMRFFIGIDYKEPRAFGIYKEANGNCVVYKNKGNGERAIRYQGTDEAYAVNEIYQKMKAELLERKQADINNAKSRTTSSSSTKKSSRSSRGLRRGIITLIIITGIFALSMILAEIEDARTPNRGYYDYNGDAFYYAAGAWYTADDDGVWERTYDVPDTLEENYKDYFEAKDYSDLDADNVEEYQTEAYSYDNDNNDSWNDNNWDDNDWDYDYDSYDSYDSDWDSDW